MFDGGGVVDELADVVEVGLGNGRFLLLYLVPFGNKLLGYHAGYYKARVGKWGNFYQS